MSDGITRPSAGDESSATDTTAHQSGSDLPAKDYADDPELSTTVHPTGNRRHPKLTTASGNTGQEGYNGVHHSSQNNQERRGENGPQVDLVHLCSPVVNKSNRYTSCFTIKLFFLALLASVVI